MKIFFYKVLVFLIPIIAFLITIVLIDFFKVFFTYEDYYKDNFVTLNREVVTTNTFLRNSKVKKIDSFIFGSSRSQAFKCKEWVKYLPKNSNPFHFDASNEGSLGVLQKLRYLDKNGDSVKNALIIIDREFLFNIYKKKGHIFVPTPLVSGDSYVSFYKNFVVASLNGEFLISYIDFLINKKYKGYMGWYIERTKNPHKFDSNTGDLFYGFEDDIKADSIGYYKLRLDKGIFNRLKYNKFECKITKEEVLYLDGIKQILNKHKTDYRIIISPIYDQIKIESDQLKLINSIFGRERVFDFSGVNDFTSQVSNYYEESHFRPLVANKILEKVYR